MVWRGQRQGKVHSVQVNERVCSLESDLHDARWLELRIVTTFGKLPMFTRRREEEFLGFHHNSFLQKRPISSEVRLLRRKYAQTYVL